MPYRLDYRVWPGWPAELGSSQARARGAVLPGGRHFPADPRVEAYPYRLAAVKRACIARTDSILLLERAPPAGTRLRQADRAYKAAITDLAQQASLSD